MVVCLAGKRSQNLMSFIFNVAGILIIYELALQILMGSKIGPSENSGWVHLLIFHDSRILIGEKYSLYIICNDSNKSDCDVNYVNESNFNFFIAVSLRIQQFTIVQIKVYLQYILGVKKTKQKYFHGLLSGWKKEFYFQTAYFSLLPLFSCSSTFLIPKVGHLRILVGFIC